MIFRWLYSFERIWRMTKIKISEIPADQFREKPINTANAQKTIKAAIFRGMLISTSLFRIRKSLNMAISPKIRQKLVILLPIMLVTTNWLCPERAEKIVEINSGMEVPKATMVKPMRKSLTFNFLARAVLWLTNTPADFTKAKMLIKIISKVNIWI